MRQRTVSLGGSEPANRPGPRAQGRRTNLALLVLLISAFATGLTTQALGTPLVGGWMAIMHGVVGLSVVLLSPWKTRVAQRGIARQNRKRILSLLMALLAVMVLVSGILHSIGLPTHIGPFTVLWVHVATALVMIPLAVWHVLARKTTPRPVDASRRNIIRLGGLASSAALLWWGADRTIALAQLPGGARRFSGSHERSSFVPEGVPVTSWLDDRTPSLDASTWQIEFDDFSGRRFLSLSELTAMEDETFTAELDCTSGWYSRQLWSGVRLDRLIDPGEERSVTVWSATGYARRFPVGDLGRLWLVTAVGEKPLSPGHGFPARLVAPDRRGFWWVKWVVRIETSNVPWWVQSPYPLS